MRSTGSSRLWTPNGALVAGEENDDVLARLALRSLSSLTVSYAFGTYEGHGR